MERRGKQEIDFRRAEVKRLLARRREDEQQGDAQQQERQIRLGQPAEESPGRVVSHRGDEQRRHDHHREDADREDDQEMHRAPCARRETAGASSP